MWETGDRVPDTPTIHRLAEIFDISADYLLGLSDNPSPVIKNVDDKDGLAFIDGETPLTEEEKEYLKESLELFRRMKAKREQQKP
ncbi:hypothetical protein SAMN04489735_10718 [Aneurinibacillus thermoaerophilus]|uniref:HTH cro/C1-type domain-containing protein n=2 Tax=Aneurinibacillus thermoaerophilus TaxID=143495 RepID=A0A1G8FKI4_ANETH|nr:hypothetical protein SAMN04489735_10718 [Aneurinibacillus thermoaerophilus]